MLRRCRFPNLKELYTARLKETQIALGLRLRSFTPEEAEKAWAELARLEALFDKVDEWRNAGYFISDARDPVKTQRAHADELRQRLEGYQRPDSPQTDQTRLITLNFLLDNIDLLDSKQWFKLNSEKENIAAPLKAERQELQIRLGLISAPKPAEPAPVESVPEIKPVVVESAPPPKPMSERFWNAIFSERTLQALIFLGIFLLFTAAISFVIWGWKDFSGIRARGNPDRFYDSLFRVGLAGAN